MIIIADSGSTKADWKTIEKNGRQTLISTIGLNPVFHTTESVLAELNKNLVPNLPNEAVEEVTFYGAGCWDYKRKIVLIRALKQLFPLAQVTVEHDLLASARAACGIEPGIACILGTGSNSCLYDGKDVIDNVKNLGYLIGDEGSGSFLGKMLIRAYFYREMPEELAEAFDEFQPGGKSAMLDKLYGKETPNVYLASMTRFLKQNLHHFFIQKLVAEGFAEFIDRHVRKYSNHTTLPIHFIGSIAFYFQDILKVVLEERNMTMGNIIRKPIEALTDFHLKYTKGSKVQSSRFNGSR